MIALKLPEQSAPLVSPLLLSVTLTLRLEALQRSELLPPKHPAVHCNPWLRIAYDSVVRHAPTVLAAIEADRLLPPHVTLDGILPFDLNLIRLVVCPHGTVAPADGAEAFECWFAQGRKGEPDGFAVACYL